MARAKDKAPLPWSIKGISPEAREAAKAAAAAEGLTMGEWMSRAIRRAGGDQAPSDAVSPPGLEPTDLPVDRLVDRGAFEAEVAKRIRATEERLIGVVEPLYDIIGELRRRLDRLEARRPPADSETGSGGPSE